MDASAFYSYFSPSSPSKGALHGRHRGARGPRHWALSEPCRAGAPLLDPGLGPPAAPPAEPLALPGGSQTVSRKSAPVSRRCTSVKMVRTEESEGEPVSGGGDAGLG